MLRPKETGRRGPRRRHAADGRVVHARAAVARVLVRLLVETRVVGNVHHACHAQQDAVGVEHRQAVEVPSGHGLFIEIEHGDQLYRLRLGADRPRGGAGNGLGDLVRVPLFVLWEELVDGQLGKHDHVGVSPGRRTQQNKVIKASTTSARTA